MGDTSCFLRYSKAAADIIAASIAISLRWLGQSAMRMRGEDEEVGPDPLKQLTDCCRRLAVTRASLG